MASEIRVNQIQNRSGLSTVTFSDTGVVIAGVTTVGILSATGNSVFSGSVNVSGTISGNVSASGVSTFETLRATNIVGVSTAGITTAYISSVNDGPISGARNRIINGDMRIWQRGTSFANSPSPTYFADRFVYSGAGLNITVTQDTDVPNKGFKYSLKAVPFSSATPTECSVRQFLEQQNIYDFAGQTVTGSAWVKCSKSQVFFRLGAQNATGGADSSQTINVTSGSWTKISFAFSSYSAVTGWTATPIDRGGFFDIGFVPSTALTASDYLFITGVQLEPGTVATPFERRSYGQELALCQRYYETGYYYHRSGVSNASIITSYYTTAYFKVTKRANPTITGTNGQGTFDIADQSAEFAALGRSNTVANTNNSGTYVASIEL